MINSSAKFDSADVGEVAQADKRLLQSTGVRRFVIRHKFYEALLRTCIVILLGLTYWAGVMCMKSFVAPISRNLAIGITFVITVAIIASIILPLFFGHRPARLYQGLQKRWSKSAVLKMVEKNRTKDDLDKHRTLLGEDLKWYCNVALIIAFCSTLRWLLQGDQTSLGPLIVLSIIVAVLLICFFLKKVVCEIPLYEDLYLTQFSTECLGWYKQSETVREYVKNVNVAGRSLRVFDAIHMFYLFEVELAASREERERDAYFQLSTAGVEHFPD